MRLLNLGLGSRWLRFHWLAQQLAQLGKYLWLHLSRQKYSLTNFQLQFQKYQKSYYFYPSACRFVKDSRPVGLQSGQFVLPMPQQSGSGFGRPTLWSLGAEWNQLDLCPKWAATPVSPSLSSSQPKSHEVYIFYILFSGARAVLFLSTLTFVAFTPSFAVKLDCKDAVTLGSRGRTNFRGIWTVVEFFEPLKEDGSEGIFSPIELEFTKSILFIYNIPFVNCTLASAKRSPYQVSVTKSQRTSCRTVQLRLTTLPSLIPQA